MNNEIQESFSQMVKAKSLDKDVLGKILEDIFGLLIKKKFGQDANYFIGLNMDKGNIEIFLERRIVETVENPACEISFEDINALGNDEGLELGDDYIEKVDLSLFGRRHVNLAKQSLSQKIREIEKEITYKDYGDKVGEIIVGDIYQVRKNDILINHNKNELILPRKEQLPKERYRKGETIRAIVKEVKKTQNGPVIIISRSDNLFLKRLFEIEIPEIYDGIIEIKGIARIPGERAKVAVESQDARIDAVGACVGMKGVRVHAIVRELNNENIDVLSFSTDPGIYIQRALGSNKIKQLDLDETNRMCYVKVDSEHVSQIVGRFGANLKLAMELTGYNIEIIREEKPFEEYEEDIELVLLRKELGSEIIDLLIDNRLDTAKEVLTTGIEGLAQFEGLDAEKAAEIIEKIKDLYTEEE
ncbi:MAG: transcription termination factor NusA [Ignavibacteriales bacterium]|nr:transcription termination factor NusA [Ignavibacteriales bacterium]MCF8435969.1 transcription termination factor NusA [Ignavibacteriales bacterium]